MKIQKSFTAEKWCLHSIKSGFLATRSMCLSLIWGDPGLLFSPEPHRHNVWQQRRRSTCASAQSDEYLCNSFKYRDRGAAGSSLTSVTVLCSWARRIDPSLVLIQPKKSRPYITERLLMGRKESNQSTIIAKVSYLDLLNAKFQYSSCSM